MDTTKFGQRFVNQITLGMFGCERTTLIHPPPFLFSFLSFIIHSHHVIHHLLLFCVHFFLVIVLFVVVGRFLLLWRWLSATAAQLLLLMSSILPKSLSFHDNP